MDDSNDAIRKETTVSFGILFRNMQENKKELAEPKDPETVFAETYLAEMVRELLIHMDDTNADVQQNVLDCLKEAAAVDPQIVLEETLKIKEYHRLSKYTSELIETCSKQQQQQNQRQAKMSD